MTFDYKIVPLQNEILDSPDEISGFSQRRKTVTRRFRKDRRRKKRDRRQGIRDGVIVSLSFQGNRRRGSDRRKVKTNIGVF